MDKTSSRDAIWLMHHNGRSISQISKELGLTPSFVRREILLRWAYDEHAPEGVKNGRDKHDRE